MRQLWQGLLRRETCVPVQLLVGSSAYTSRTSPAKPSLVTSGWAACGKVLADDDGIPWRLSQWPWKSDSSMSYLLTLCDHENRNPTIACWEVKNGLLCGLVVVVVVVAGGSLCHAAYLPTYLPPSLLASYLVDPASSHMLVSKIKPCMCKYKPVPWWNCEWLIKSVVVP